MSTSQTETFFDELFQLTVRHIRYGVKSHYMPPFGKALIETFEEIAGEEWTKETAVAWEEVWNRAADSMMRGLNFGASPLVHALVDGSIGQLKLAVSEFPREARALKLCQIDIESTQVSPIVWALHDGNVELAAFIIKDLLTIRADLHGYYYGRDMLFKYHPDIVGMLGRDHPQLMGPLLDGLLWHSREKTDRKVRVSYFIAELFGNPNQFQDPWTSPLARLVEYADNKTIGHPVVNKLLEIKWRKFGLKLFCLQEGWYLLPLVLYMIEHNLSDEHSDDSLDCHSYTRVNLRRTLVAFAIINIIVQVCAWGQQLHDKKVKAAELWGWRISVPRTASNWWLWLRVASWFVLIVVYSGHDCEEFSGNFSPCFALENGSYVPETCWADSSSVIFAEGN
ncbi:MAG: globin domain-containing protein, partial [Promethearchaeia archaeon]